VPTCGCCTRARQLRLTKRRMEGIGIPHSGRSLNELQEAMQPRREMFDMSTTRSHIVRPHPCTQWSLDRQKSQIIFRWPSPQPGIHTSLPTRPGRAKGRVTLYHLFYQGSAAVFHPVSVRRRMASRSTGAPQFPEEFMCSCDPSSCSYEMRLNKGAQ
jgi:hypothetical protein